MNDEEWNAWPNCVKEGCPNKCCLRLRSIYCYPHTLGLPLDFLTVGRGELEEEKHHEPR